MDPTGYPRLDQRGPRTTVVLLLPLLWQGLLQTLCLGSTSPTSRGDLYISESLGPSLGWELRSLSKGARGGETMDTKLITYDGFSKSNFI